MIHKTWSNSHRLYLDRARPSQGQSAPSAARRAQFRGRKESLFAANARAPEIAPRPSNFLDAVSCARSFDGGPWFRKFREEYVGRWGKGKVRKINLEWLWHGA